MMGFSKREKEDFGASEQGFRFLSEQQPQKNYFKLSEKDVHCV
jgi:hypothetical protein